MITFSSLSSLFHRMAPEYKSWTERNYGVCYPRDPNIHEALQRWGPRRYRNRLEAYLIPGELERARRHADGSAGASIRFGHEKKGHGFEGERGDFCLVGGVYRRKVLTLLYRRVELLGGFFYDQALIHAVHENVGPVKTIVVHATEACVYARRGNSNEKLYARLKAHYDQA